MPSKFQRTDAAKQKLKKHVNKYGKVRPLKEEQIFASVCKEEKLPWRTHNKQRHTKQDKQSVTVLIYLGHY